MQTNFSKEVELTPTFNGNRELPEEQQIKYALTVLEVGPFYDMVELVQRLGIKKGDDNKIDMTTVDKTAQREFMLAGSKYLTAATVRSIGAPLLAKDGSVVGIEVIGRAASFLSLATELLWNLVFISAPTDVDLGN